jgi:hypothetical protein
MIPRRVFLMPNINKKTEWLLVIKFHMFVGAGVALLAAGSSRLQKADATSHDLGILKAGIVLLTLSWIILIAWTGITVYSARGRMSNANDGAKTVS